MVICPRGSRGFPPAAPGVFLVFLVIYTMTESELEVGDRIKVKNSVAVPGLEDGFTYKVTGFKTFRERPHYVLKCVETDSYSKVPVKSVDDSIDSVSTVLTV